MQVRSDRMVHLGYGKYWRADDVIGLLPIEEDRGSGRRTYVYVQGRDEPVVASRTEEAILEDMAPSREDLTRALEARQTARELLQRLRGLSPVIRRMLRSEGGLDLEMWIERLESVTDGDVGPPKEQEDLFPGV